MAGDTVALALVAGRVAERGRGTIPPAHILAALGLPAESPALPPWAERWRADQHALRAQAKSAQREVEVRSS